MNPAGISEVKKFSVDVSAERRFNLEELTSVSFALAKNTRFGTFGFLASNFGFTEYTEQKFALVYAKKLSEIVRVGAQFDLLRYNIEQVGSKNVFTFEMGVQVQLNKEFSVATHIFSPGNIYINDFTDLGTRYRVGVMYKPSAKVFLLAEADKLIYRPLEYKIGLSYQLIPEAQIRLGINPSVEFYSFGAAFSIGKSMKISSAIALQEVLGNTPAISFQYNQQ